MSDERRAAAREELVRVAERKGVRDARVLDALGEVPRHRFVPDEKEEVAYDDRPLRIGKGQVVTQPSLVARMVDAAGPGPDDEVLEIGTGSGYGAAVLSRVAGHVYTLDRFPDFAEEARRRFRELGYENITVRVGDGTLGWEEHAPYEAVVCTAGSPPEVPRPLREQLRDGGRLVIPVGPRRTSQKLYVITRRGPDGFDRERLIAVRFVPLVGAAGWPEEGGEAAGDRT